MKDFYDLIVLGAGPGGYVAAIRAAQFGMRVAIVESRQVGGTCLNRGCIPTKSLMHVSGTYEKLASCEMLGISVKEYTYDIEKMYKHKDAVVEQLRMGIEFLLKSNQVDVFTGKGIIIASDQVEVTGKDGSYTLTGSRILIATGSVPAYPPINGVNLPGVLTSDDLLENAKKYKSMTIIGGGVIGVEFATVFQALGCKVTVVEFMDKLLPTLDVEFGRCLQKTFKKRGIELFLSAQVESIKKSENGLSCLVLQKDRIHTIESEAVLVAVGRRPNIQEIFGEGVEVECDRGIVVDQHFRTSIPSIFAIGDVIHGGIQLAHVASAQGCAAIAYMSGRENEVDLRTIPSCVYTDPEIASVGMTVEQAQSENIEVKVGRFQMNGNGKSIIEGQTVGFIKLVFEAKSEVIIGAQIMCARATDMIGELATAVVNKLTAKELVSVVRPHPTFNETVSEAVEDIFGLAINNVPAKK
ncbi:Dihydrolipoyl dehydrogenase [anaerobic digester metagenome]